MGKEWYYWGGSSGRSSSKRRGASASAETEIPPPSSAGGCMCAVFQAFDFHPFHFFINHQQQPQPKPHSHKSASSNSQQDLHNSVPKGAEAPRNSLESEDGTTSSSISKEDNLKIPKHIRIKTSGGTRGRNLSDVSSEISISPGTKTPTLVARLMGLDLLPDANSSSSSSSSTLSTPKRQCNPQHHHHLKPRQQQQQHIQITRHRNSTDCITNIRSLPETPRMSLARRSDAEHHRLSLQINKENMVFGEELDPPRFSFSKRKYDENNSSSSRSPSHYARQIVKQVKDSVSRKVGLDITNTLKNKDQTLSKDELVAQFRFKKSVDESSPGKHSNPSSYSPRLSRFVDTKHKPSTKKTSSSSSSPLTPKDQNTKPPSPPPLVNIETQLSSKVLTKPKPKPKPQALAERELQRQQKPLAPKCKKVTTNERFSSRVNNKPPQTSIRNKQDESFITRASDMKTKNKRTQSISSNLLLLNGINAVPNLLPVKTDPSPPATKIPQKQVSYTQEPKRIAQLSSCSRHKYNQEPPHTHATRGTTTATDEGPEFQYIATILSRTGLRKATLPNLQFQWFSLSHPLDPSIFHNLEHYPAPDPSVSSPGNEKDCTFAEKNQLGLRCNRRLLFDLADELLSEILARPRRHQAGSLLEAELWKRVRSFRGAKCEVLEDIDGLIEMEDVKEEEEGEGLVAEIGRSIVETLVHETVTVMVGGGGGARSRK